MRSLQNVENYQSLIREYLRGFGKATPAIASLVPTLRLSLYIWFVSVLCSSFALVSYLNFHYFFVYFKFCTVLINLIAYFHFIGFSSSILSYYMHFIYIFYLCKVIYLRNVGNYHISLLSENIYVALEIQCYNVNK